MPIDYAALKSDVSAIISEFGLAAVLRRTAGGASTPWGTETAAVTDTEVTVVDTGIQDRYIAGTLTTRKARVLLVSVAAGIAPLKSDLIILGSSELDIEAVNTISPGGTDLLYEVEVQE